MFDLVGLLKAVKEAEKKHGVSVEELLVGFIYNDDLEASDRLQAIQIFYNIVLSAGDDVDYLDIEKELRSGELIPMPGGKPDKPELGDTDTEG